MNKPGEPRNAIDRDALIDAIAQGLRGTWHCTRAWEAWHIGTMSQDDFEPVDESETPTEIADAVLAMLAAHTLRASHGQAPAGATLYQIMAAAKELHAINHPTGEPEWDALRQCEIDALRRRAERILKAAAPAAPAQPAPATPKGDTDE